MTARLDVTPKTTEQNRIVRTSKSEAEVTNKKLRSRYCTTDATKLTTDRHEASRGLFVTAELLVIKKVQTMQKNNTACHSDMHKPEPKSGAHLFHSLPRKVDGDVMERVELQHPPPRCPTARYILVNVRLKSCHFSG